MKRNFYPIETLATKHLTWGKILGTYLVFVTALLLASGCSTFVSGSLGDHTVRAGVTLSHEVRDD